MKNLLLIGTIWVLCGTVAQAGDIITINSFENRTLRAYADMWDEGGGGAGRGRGFGQLRIQ